MLLGTLLGPDGTQMNKAGTEPMTLYLNPQSRADHKQVSEEMKSPASELLGR